MPGICLATEDVLSEVVGTRLAVDAGLGITIWLRRDGNGYLRNRVRNFCEMSRNQPVLLITDLDNSRCAAQLIDKWLGAQHRPNNFLFRVAVREVESWLLADHHAMREFLRLNSSLLPRSPDDLVDPKAQLISLARRGPRNVREDLVPAARAIASQGVGYNARLTEFVRNQWEPARASLRSPSLRRARQRIAELAHRI